MQQFGSPSRINSVQRPTHPRGFAPGARSRLFLHVSVHTRERFQVPSICPGSILRMKYTHEIVGTLGTFAPGVCLEHAPGAKSLVCTGLNARALLARAKARGQLLSHASQLHNIIDKGIDNK